VPWIAQFTAGLLSEGKGSHCYANLRSSVLEDKC